MKEIIKSTVVENYLWCKDCKRKITKADKTDVLRTVSEVSSEVVHYPDGKEGGFYKGREYHYVYRVRITKQIIKEVDYA